MLSIEKHPCATFEKCSFRLRISNEEHFTGQVQKLGTKGYFVKVSFGSLWKKIQREKDMEMAGRQLQTT